MNASADDLLEPGQGYAVIYTEYVRTMLLQEVESKRVYESIDRYRDILQLFPEIGQEYEPQYPAAKPPFPCRFIPVHNTPFTLYYIVEEAGRIIVVFYLEHQRSNPRTRFSGILGSN